AQQGAELVLDRLQGRRVEEQRLLHAYQLARLEQELEELVLLVAGKAGTPQRLLGAGRRRRRLAEFALEPVHRRLLDGAQAQLVRGQPDLVAVHANAALGIERAEDVREHALVGVGRSHAQLLARHPATERLGSVELLERARDEPAQARHRVGVQPPMVTIGEYERITKRSPASATRGASRRSRAKPRAPGASSAPSSRSARAMISLVPACSRTRSRLFSGRAASARISRTTSTSVVAESVPACP